MMIKRKPVKLNIEFYCGLVILKRWKYNMTDHYFERETLKEMGRSVSEGSPSQVDQESYESLVAQIRSSKNANQ
jgi:hypothetical protein